MLIGAIVMYSHFENTSNQLTPKIGISNFSIYEHQFDSIAANKKRLSRQKFEADQKHFNTPVWDFADESLLSLKQKELLHNLECRADKFLGDTRWYTVEIVQALGFSKATVDRYLKKLKDLGFISIITKAYSKNGKVYKNRIIRCKRIWLKYKFFVDENLYSKNRVWDIRRAYNQNQAIRLAKKVYNIDVPYKYFNPKISFKKHHEKLISENKISYQQENLLSFYDSEKKYKDSLARAVCGWASGLGSYLIKRNKNEFAVKNKTVLMPLSKHQKDFMDNKEDEEIDNKDNFISFRSDIEKERDLILNKAKEKHDFIVNKKDVIENIKNLNLSSFQVFNVPDKSDDLTESSEFQLFLKDIEISALIEPVTDFDVFLLKDIPEPVNQEVDNSDDYFAKLFNKEDKK